MGLYVISESGCMVLGPIGLSQRQRRKNEWTKELKSDPVLCKSGIEAKHRLVPFEIGVCYFVDIW